jgi:hypothetical protein
MTKAVLQPVSNSLLKDNKKTPDLIETGGLV